MSIRWLSFSFWLYLLVLVCTAATAANPVDPDLWHRLALGETLWKTQHFPPGGTFSYLADYRHIADHEWGSALLFYLTYAMGGGSAFVFVKVLTLAATLTLLAGAGLQGRRPTLLLAAFYALILLALLPSFQSTVRCEIFTHLFLALWLFWYQREKHGRFVSLWVYLLTMVLWANLHGGFFIGLAWLFGVMLVNPDTRKKWALRFALCSLATLINPFGWRLWISTGRALFTTRRGFDEWAPVSWWPDPTSFFGYKVLLFVTAAVLLVYIWRNPKPRAWSLVCLIGGAFIFSFTSARNASLFSAVSGALLPSLFPRESCLRNGLTEPIPRLALLAASFALVLLPFFAALSLVPGDSLVLSFPPISCPVQAVSFLQQQNVRGNLLVPFNYGSYALWHLRGRMRVSMDGRYDLVYRPETYRRVDDFFLARGDWIQLLHQPAPAAILLPRLDPVYKKLCLQSGWTEAYHDSTDAVFLRR